MAYEKKRHTPSGGRRPFGNSSRPSGSRSGGRRFGGGRGGGKGPKKENIHPSKFIKAAVVAKKEEVYVPKNTFADFKVIPILARNIAARKFITPSPIQDQSIPVSLEGGDIIGIANTGTGKTVAFGIPVIDRLLRNRKSKVIIMAPTRELAGQILDELRTLTRSSPLKTALLIGGSPMYAQLRDLKHRPQIIIGTPGRIKDHLERKSLNLTEFDTVVLDEVDRMLDMGFVNDMRAILGKMKKERQSYFFSATMDPKVRSLINEFSHEAVTVSVKTGDTSDNVEQSVVQYKSLEDKMEKLQEILKSNDDNKVLIFDETKRGVERLSKSLIMRGFKTESIHGDKSQGQRQRALLNFKRNKARIMIATDVAARGIDVPDITHVINYATPQSYSDYVHRIGRAGRAGKTGQAMTFVDEIAILAASRTPAYASRSRQNARPVRSRSHRPYKR